MPAAAIFCTVKNSQKNTRQISLIRIAFIRGAVMLAIMISSLGVSLYAIHQQTLAQNTKEMQQQINEHAQAISQQLSFYRTVLKQVAKQHELQDLLTIGDSAVAEEWAKKHRGYLPNNVGLALVSTDSGVLGTPPELRVGPACLVDLGKILSLQPLMEPLVHRDNPQLAHFDLLEPITDGLGQPLGLMFASFSLNSLQATLEKIVRQDQALLLQDSQGEVIVQAGEILPSTKTRHLTTTITDSTWKLGLTQPEPDNTDIYLALGGTNIVATIVIITLLVSLTIMLVRIFTNELVRIKTLLDQIQAGQTLEISATGIKETEDIMPAISNIAENIQQQQMALSELSLTDELTGLPNRRYFNLELQRAFNLSKRGISICLVMLDLDHFKEINDAGGHALGDRVLQILGQVLKQDIRKTDFSARLGGDEFVVIFTNMSPQDIHPWIGKMTGDFVVLWHDEPLVSPWPACTLSGGVTFVDSQHDTEPDEILRRADAALYQAKANGRNRIEVRLAGQP